MYPWFGKIQSVEDQPINNDLVYSKCEHLCDVMLAKMFQNVCYLDVSRIYKVYIQVLLQNMSICLFWSFFIKKYSRFIVFNYKNG